MTQPNHRIPRIAVIGAGHWGPNLIRNFHNHTTSEVVWVIDRDEARLKLAESRYPGIRTATDPAAAFADPQVDAVVISTPTITHYELAKAALEAGKHALVEKPVAASAEEADALCDLAERRGLILMVGQVFLFNAAIRRVREYLAQGELGRLFYISMVRTNLGPIRMDVNAAWDLAAHDIAIANDWLGAIPLQAAAQGGSWINEGIEDAVFANLWYPGGVMVNLHVSWLSPRKVRDITIVGEKGMLTFDDMNLAEPLRLYDKQVTDQLTPAGFVDTFASFRTSIHEGDIQIPKVAAGEPLKAECDHFLECVASGKPPISGGRSGAGAVRVLDALSRSLRNDGRRETV